MFLKTSAYKKLLKEAWDGGGLIVGSSEEHLYISGGWWILKVLKEKLNNKEKAALIELAGELPEPGETYRAIKDQCNQYEAGRVEQMEEILQREYKHLYSKTRIVYQMALKSCRVFQEQFAGNCLYVHNIISDLIDIKSMDVTEETPPEGPFGKPGLHMLIWKNNIMTFSMFAMNTEDKTEEAEILSLLESVALPTMNG